MSHQRHEKNPRPSNTGVHSSKAGGSSRQTGVLFPLKQGIEIASSGEQKALVSLDWLAFTVPVQIVEYAWKQAKAGRDALAPSVSDGPMFVLELARVLQLPCETVTDTGRGFQGWSRAWSLDDMGGAKLAVGGQNGTARVVLSAEALRFYQANGWDVQEWARHMHEIGARCRHIDMAFDDLGGWLSREKIIEAAFAHNVVSRYGNKYDPRVILGRASGADGWTIDFGAYGGQTFVKIYDKAKERAVKGHELPEDTHWVRVEATFRGDRAEKALAGWIADGFTASFAVALLRGLLDFRECQEDEHNKDRWPLLPWWGDFLGAAEVVHLGTDAKDRAVCDYYEFLRNQAAAALALVNDFYGEEAIARLIADGRERLGPRHQHAMDLSRAMGDVALPE
jgi:hypothetical protein